VGFEFTGWLGQTISDVINLFKEKFLASWENHVTDCLAIEEGFNTWYLKNVLKDTAGVAGLELLRGIIGITKVKQTAGGELFRLLDQRLKGSGGKGAKRPFFLFVLLQVKGRLPLIFLQINYPI
jgi:hypothetical protein